MPQFDHARFSASFCFLLLEFPLFANVLPIMNVIVHSNPDFSAQLDRLLAPSSLFDPAIEQQTQGIIDAVRKGGDAAVAELTERFNGPKLTPDQFAVTQAEWLAASVLCQTLAAQGLVHAQQPRRDGRGKI